MTIDEKTAQLILDALAWSNDNWLKDLEEEWPDSLRLAIARVDFTRFCEDRGITTIERKVSI